MHWWGEIKESPHQIHSVILSPVTWLTDSVVYSQASPVACYWANKGDCWRQTSNPMHPDTSLSRQGMHTECKQKAIMNEIRQSINSMQLSVYSGGLYGVATCRGVRLALPCGAYTICILVSIWHSQWTGENSVGNTLEPERYKNKKIKKKALTERNVGVSFPRLPTFHRYLGMLPSDGRMR